MDFTREPIIETIITPKEGYKLAVKSSKNPGEEEYFVEALELVSFGHAFFFRSMERPKAFLLPVHDYEVLEVREARITLKNAEIERSIKIGGGRDGAMRPSKELEKVEVAPKITEPFQEKELSAAPAFAESKADSSAEAGRLDKKKERRRHPRRRRGREEADVEMAGSQEIAAPYSEENAGLAQLPTVSADASASSSVIFSGLLQPPPTLISDSIGHYREKFKSAFFLTEEEEYKPHAQTEILLSEDEAEEEVFPSISAPPLLDVTPDPIPAATAHAEGVEFSETDVHKEWEEQPLPHETFETER